MNTVTIEVESSILEMVLNAARRRGLVTFMKGGRNVIRGGFAQKDLSHKPNPNAKGATRVDELSPKEYREFMTRNRHPETLKKFEDVISREQGKS